MKSDHEIQQAVEQELNWDPHLDAENIAVLVRGGAVTLAGFVSGVMQKFEAEQAAKRVFGVIGVANDLEVRVPSIDQRPDPEIARVAVAALRAQLPDLADRLKLTVANGWITLDGEVEWAFQKERAESGMRAIKGTMGVINMIEVKAGVTPAQIKKKIEEAFRRSAEQDANGIEVEIIEGQVILKGTVHSWHERTQAERAAWSMPGVKKVEDLIVIRP